MKKTIKKKIVYISEYEPIIDVGGDNWGATYYNDLSGELRVGSEDESLSFFRDDGGLKGQIEYLKEYMEEREEAFKTDIKMCKEAIRVLNKELAAYKTKKYIVKEQK